MTIFNVISLAGGLALFLYGMSIMGTGWRNTPEAGWRASCRSSLRPPGAPWLSGPSSPRSSSPARVPRSLWWALSTRASCSFPRPSGIIMGANIGTTVTGQIIRLSDISGGGMLMEFLKPATFAPILAFVGAVLFVFIKSPRKRDIGQIFMGFGLLFIGMGMMTDSVSTLRESELFVRLFTTLAESHSGRSGGYARHGGGAELLGVRGHFAGAFQHRPGHLGQRHPPLFWGRTSAPRPHLSSRPSAHPRRPSAARWYTFISTLSVRSYLWRPSTA